MVAIANKYAQRNKSISGAKPSDLEMCGNPPALASALGNFKRHAMSMPSKALALELRLFCDPYGELVEYLGIRKALGRCDSDAKGSRGLGMSLLRPVFVVWAPLLFER